MAISKDILEKAEAAAAKIDADIFLFNGGVARVRDLECMEAVFAHKGRSRAILMPVTSGGDPDAAYKIARYLQDHYEGFTALITGICKSAGTLMALGATELAFTPFGELGPLDIQLTKVDRFDQMRSGLTIQDALDTMEGRALQSFYKVIQDYMQANSGLISFSTASKAASDFVAQLYAPVFSRIDPEEIGGRARSMRIATEYGKRLSVKAQNLKPDTLRALAETYPSHSFAIDQREAEGLFHRVRSATAAEKALVGVLGNFSRFEVPRPTDFVSERYPKSISRGRAMMPIITEEEARRQMAEILREQMERPSLRPNPREDGGDGPFRKSAGQPRVPNEDRVSEYARI